MAWSQKESTLQSEEGAQPALGGRKFTEYIEHSSWMARHNSKGTVSKDVSNVTSSSLSGHIPKKEVRRKPLFMLRSVTVSGDPSKGVAGMRTSKQVQVQESDFTNSRDSTKISFSRKTTEVSVSDLDKPETLLNKRKKTVGKLRGWSPREENGDGEEERGVGRSKSGGSLLKEKYVSSRHHTELNDVMEEANEDGDLQNSQVASARHLNPTPGEAEMRTVEGSGQQQVAPPQQSGYFNPFQVGPPSQTSPYQYPPPVPMFYPMYPNPYPHYYPYWAGYDPYQMGAPPGVVPRFEQDDIKLENLEETEAAHSKVKKESGRNFVKDNKNTSKDANKKKSEEHGEEPITGKKVEEDDVMTHTTVKDDNRVKVDINLNISGRHLASLLGLDHNSAPSPRSPFYPRQHHSMYPIFPPMYGPTVPETSTGRPYKPEALVVDQPKRKLDKQMAANQNRSQLEEQPMKNKKLSPYPVVPPIKSAERQQPMTMKKQTTGKM